MAKLRSIALKHIPSGITINDDSTKMAIISTEIEFHPLDLRLKMEYMLHLYLYDVNEEKDIPLLVPNWDDTDVLRVDNGNLRDDFIAKRSVYIKEDQLDALVLNLETPLKIKPGEMKENTSLYARHFQVYGTLIPAIYQASTWSRPFESQLFLSKNSITEQEA